MLLIAGVSVTHHVSSYLAAISIVLFWLLSVIRHRRLVERLLVPAIASVVLPIAWLSFEPHSIHYLKSNLGSRFTIASGIIGKLSKVGGRVSSPRRSSTRAGPAAAPAAPRPCRSSTT